MAVVDAAYQGCCDYFNTKNYYRGWFDKLNEVLARAGASYHDRTACHLDLVQAATDPVWDELDPAEKAALLAADAGFLPQLINHGNFDLLLLNGRQCLEVVSAALPVAWATSHPFLHLGKQYVVKEGTYGHRHVVAWSQKLHIAIAPRGFEVRQRRQWCRTSTDCMTHVTRVS
jgi:hypothetical protein